MNLFERKRAFVAATSLGAICIVVAGGAHAGTHGADILTASLTVSGSNCGAPSGKIFGARADSLDSNLNFIQRTPLTSGLMTYIGASGGGAKQDVQAFMCNTSNLGGCEFKCTSAVNNWTTESTCSFVANGCVWTAHAKGIIN